MPKSKGKKLNAAKLLQAKPYERKKDQSSSQSNTAVDAKRKLHDIDKQLLELQERNHKGSKNEKPALFALKPSILGSSEAFRVTTAKKSDIDILLENEEDAQASASIAKKESSPMASKNAFAALYESDDEKPAFTLKPSILESGGSHHRDDSYISDSDI